jgi:hypothetical protein
MNNTAFLSAADESPAAGSSRRPMQALDRKPASRPGTRSVPIPNRENASQKH